MTVYFKYEKVENFCFVCVVLGHTKAFYPKKVEPGYVEGLRGISPSKIRPQIVTPSFLSLHVAWLNFLRTESFSVTQNTTHTTEISNLLVLEMDSHHATFTSFTTPAFLLRFMNIHQNPHS